MFDHKSVMSSLGGRPAAYANIQGGAEHPELNGTVRFFPYRRGAIVMGEFWGLPYDPAPCAANIYAIHIHAGGSCAGEEGMPFSAAKGHYNPQNCPHPAHAGDLPPLFSDHGYAWQGFYTERFTPREIIGKTVIVHDRRDDFTTQPAGDAGSRIACGVIRASR